MIAACTKLAVEFGKSVINHIPVGEEFLDRVLVDTFFFSKHRYLVL
jgi:hypothetical protein